MIEEQEEEWCVAGFCEKTTFRSRLLPVRVAKEMIREAAAVGAVKK